jgi:hypothetical protein
MNNRKDYHHQRYLENKERILKQTKEYYESHKEQRKEYNLEHKEKILKKVKIWNDSHPEKRKEFCKNYRDENPYKIDFAAMIQRTTNPNNKFYKYYKNRRGNATLEDFQQIWKRDNSKSMQRPEIDRIDNGRGYFKDNIQYLEREEHILKTAQEIRQRKINRDLLKIGKTK